MQARKTKRLLAPLSDDPSPVGRLVLGMLESLRERPYADTTVADVVRHARVSKRTFYEHFPDKEACFLASYRAVSDEVQRHIGAAVSSVDDAEQQLEAATSAYFRALEQEPALTRTFLTDLPALGAQAQKARRAVHQRFAALLMALVAQRAREKRDVRPLDAEMATALVGGIHELVLLKLETEEPAKLHALSGTAMALLRAVLRT